MRAGSLNERITIQRKTITQSPSGEQIETWSAISGCERRSAGKRPLRGDERYSGTQIIGQEQVEFRIRYSTNVADLTPKDRIIWPALSENSPEDIPDTRRIFDILAVNEVGHREAFLIVTQRRADASQ